MPSKQNPLPWRLKRSLGMILRQNPDIICIQEMDRFEDFLKILKPLGYEGVFQQKPHNILDKVGGKKIINPAAKFNGGKGADGVAIFWNTERLNAVNHQGRRLHKYNKKKKCPECRVEVEKFEADENFTCSICGNKDTSMYKDKEVIQVRKYGDGDDDWEDYDPKKYQIDQTKDEGDIRREIKKLLLDGKKPIYLLEDHQMELFEFQLRNMGCEHKLCSGCATTKGNNFHSNKPGDLAKQVILAVELFDNKTEKKFVAVTSHLKSGQDKKKDIPDKKWMAMEVAEMLHEYNKNNIPVIFCSDFNSKTSTEAYKMFYDGPEAEGIENDHEFKNPHDVKSFMSPAYDLERDEKEKRFSAIKVRLGGKQARKIGVRDLHTIDFIFHSHGDKGFEVKATLKIPCSEGILSSEEYLTKHKRFRHSFVPYKERKCHFLKNPEAKEPEDEVVNPEAEPFIPKGEEAKKLGLPNFRYPSDHFMKVADLVWAA